MFNSAMLVKDVVSYKQLSLFKKIKDIAWWVEIFGYWIFNFFAMDNKSLDSYYIIPAILLGVIVAMEIIYSICLNVARSRQVLKDDNEVDKAFISANAKYSKNFKRSAIVYTICAIVSVAMIAAIAAIGLSAGHEGELDQEQMPVWAIPFSIVFLAVVFTIIIYAIVNSTKFSKKVSAEMAIIVEYFIENGKMSQNSARAMMEINNADQQKALSYFYPDAKIRKRVYKSAMIYLICLVASALTCGVLFALFLLNNNTIAVYFTAAALVVILFVGTLINMQIVKKNQAEQRILYNEDKEKYAYHISLQDSAKTYARQNNIQSLVLMGLLALLAVVLCIAFPMYSNVVISFSLFAWMILSVAISILGGKNYRKVEMQLKRLIDMQSEAEKLQTQIDELQQPEDK